MPKRLAIVTVDFLLYDDDWNETECTAEVKVSPETEAYFDKSYGNWLPGDPWDVDILKVWKKGSPNDTLDLNDLSDYTVESITEEAINQFRED